MDAKIVLEMRAAQNGCGLPSPSFVHVVLLDGKKGRCVMAMGYVVLWEMAQHVFESLVHPSNTDLVGASRRIAMCL